MEIKVGEYVRTPLGIAKYLGKYEDMPNFYQFDKLDEELWFGDIADVIYKNQLDEVVLKHSPNIIDLLELGDFVNRSEVVCVKNNSDEVKCVYVDTKIYHDQRLTEDEIVSVITHEQMEEMEYEL